MTKKKSILTWILALVLIVPCMFVLTACGDVDPRFADAMAINISFTDSYHEDEEVYHSAETNVNATDTYCFSFTKGENDVEGAMYVFAFADYVTDSYMSASRFYIQDEEYTIELYNAADASTKIDESKIVLAKGGEGCVFDIENGDYYVLVTFTSAHESIMAMSGYLLAK